MRKLLSAFVLVVALGSATWSAASQTSPQPPQTLSAPITQLLAQAPGVQTPAAVPANPGSTSESESESEAAKDARHIRFLYLLGGLLVLVIGLLAALQWRFQRLIEASLKGENGTINPGEGRMEVLRLLQASPAGLPEGSIRAALSLLIVAIGLAALMLEFPNANTIVGILGTVVGFYFGARTNDGAVQQQAAQAAKATDKVNELANRAIDQTNQLATQAVNQAAATQASANSALTAAAAAVASPGAAAAGVSDQQKRLLALRDKMTAARQVLSILGDMPKGANVLNGTQGILAKTDGLLTAIGPLLTGKPQATEINAVADNAEALLTELDTLGLPGVLGDAIATFRSASSTLSTAVSGGAAIAAFAGGPAGIVAALLLGGLSLYRDQQKFQKWQAAVLAQPYALGLTMPEVDETWAQLAVNYSSVARARLPEEASGSKLDLLKACLSNEITASAKELAAQLRQSTELGKYFATDDELAEAIEEIRHGAVYEQLRGTLAGTIAIDVALPGEAAALGKGFQAESLLDCIDALRRDRNAAAEIDRLASIAQALAAQKALPTTDVASLIVDALSKGIELAATARATRQINA